MNVFSVLEQKQRFESAESEHRENDCLPVTLRLNHFSPSTSEYIVAIGSARHLGCWDPTRAARAKCINGHDWVVKTMLPRRQNIEWKWAIVQRGSNTVVRFEMDGQRHLFLTNKGVIVRCEWGQAERLCELHKTVSGSYRQAYSPSSHRYFGSRHSDMDHTNRSVEEKIMEFEDRTRALSDMYEEAVSAVASDSQLESCDNEYDLDEILEEEEREAKRRRVLRYTGVAVLAVGCTFGIFYIIKKSCCASNSIQMKK